MYPAEEKTPSRAFSLFLFTYPSGSFLASPPAAAASAIVPGALRCDEPTRGETRSIRRGFVGDISGDWGLMGLWKP